MVHSFNEKNSVKCKIFFLSKTIKAAAMGMQKIEFYILFAMHNKIQNNWMDLGWKSCIYWVIYNI